MADSSDDGIPAWQRATQHCSEASTDAKATSSGGTDEGGEVGGPATEDALTIARRFLDDKKVKDEPRAKKVAFLKSKGVEDDHIQKLLGDADEAVRPHSPKGQDAPY